MSRFSKSSLTVDGNNVHMSMPFAKVDKANRLVSGFATLDNIDSQGDIVLAEASAKAFARARGNIREMHQPLAVGKMVDFREEEFYNPEDKKFYRGIFVTARVSEGAQDTWLKVLDGTLTGFSIGGEIVDASSEFVKDAGRTVRFVKDYNLVELSLVDNPANQLANVLSIQKTANGSVTVKMGEVADAVIENVFICTRDEEQTVIINASDSEDCPVCGNKMENAGWFESGPDRAEKVGGIVAKFLSPADKEAAPSSESEGGVEVSKSVTKSEGPAPEATPTEVVNPSEKTEDGEPKEAVVEEAEAADEETDEVDEGAGTDEEESESPAEVTDDETEISKKIDELHEAVKTSLAESQAETIKKVEELEERVGTELKTILSKTSELESKVGQFEQKLETSKSRLAEFEKMLEKMNSSEAFRKSATLEPRERADKDEQDTLWNGAFSGKSGNGFSVDNLM